ncbi:MAG: aminotransferase class IV [Acidobacteria bacterium]|nr:aminotransferase class IV [Acidobacteriota bacterium]MCL5286399.1 aminotransferase class IV [Acidobacteriota bacterium]
MIHRHIFHNDRLLPIEQVRLSPGQAGLLNGWGLFTTLRVVEGEPFAYERHWKRLQKDARTLHLPMQFDAEKVRGQLSEVLRANNVTDGCARIYIVYNKVGFWASDESFPQVDLILYSAPLPAYHEPVLLALREQGRHAASPIAGVKVTSWLNNVWNLYEAQQTGCDEVVLLNERGEVAECTAANIFCVMGGTVFTPPLDSGCLEGVTRGLLEELGPKAGVPVSERVLRPDDLYAADEVFISSTNRNVLAVGEIAGHKVAAAPGAVTLKLRKIFDAYVAEYVAGVKSHAAAGRSR